MTKIAYRLLLVIIMHAFVAFPLYAQKFVNAKDFGVVTNDEQIDNSVAFKMILLYAQKNNIHIIKIPEGVFYISKGFNLPNDITIEGAGINKTVIRVIKNLPARTDEYSQTAVFTGMHAYSLADSSSTRNIVIRNLTIDLQKDSAEFDLSRFSMLGGIRLINPVNCIVDSIKIINPPKFGIGLFATKDGKLCTDNTIKNCTVLMQDNWYLQLSPEIIPRSNESCIGIELASYCGDNNNGAATHLDRKNPDYFISKTRENTIVNNVVAGGSHGISMSNAHSNKILSNVIENCSARGIIIISCTDSNLVYSNKFKNIGSTAIHLAYNCNRNFIKKNLIDGVLGVEGDGIKSYINCNGNRIEGNVIKNFARTGIRVSHGANSNSIAANKIYGNGAAIQTGIKIISNNKMQYNEGFRFENTLTAKNNVCKNNVIANVNYGVIIGDEIDIPNSVQKNKMSGNKFEKVSNRISSKSN